MLSVVIPTVTGREESLARCYRSYEQTLAGVDHELVVVKDMPNWPSACNHGYRQTSGDVVHFTADDLEALPGWHVEAVELLRREDVLPAAFVWNYVEMGDPDNVADGKPGDIVWFTRVPIMTRDQWERIGEWPDMDFYADVWLSEHAKTLGILSRLVEGYKFLHHWHQVNRISNDQKRVDRSWAQLQQLRLQMAT